jgi:hypothetical protein
MTRISKTGYRKNSKDKNEPFLQIPSNNITMLEEDGTPLKKGPILGISNTNDIKLMMPGENYKFDGTSVTEIPMAKQEGTRKVRINKIRKYQGDEDPSTVDPPVGSFYNFPTKQKGEWYYAPYDPTNPNLRIGTPTNYLPSDYSNNPYASGSYSYGTSSFDLTGKDPNSYDFTQKWSDASGELYSQPFYVRNNTIYSREPFAIGDESIKTKPIIKTAEGDLDISSLRDLNGSYFTGWPDDDILNFITGASRMPNSPLIQNPDGTFTLMTSPETNTLANALDFANNLVSRFPLVGATNEDLRWAKNLGIYQDPELLKRDVGEYFLTGVDPRISSRASLGPVNPGYSSPGITFGTTPEERYELELARRAYQGASADMQTPLAKALGSKGEPPQSAIERNARIEADKIAEDRIKDIRVIFGSLLPLKSGTSYQTSLPTVLSDETFRSILDMDPQILRDIVNSPFGTGVVKFDKNTDYWGGELTITKKEAEKLLEARAAIENSGKYNYLLEPSPADKAIQGMANTLSFLGGNWDNAEGPGTIGEMAHNLVGYNAQNKGYNLLDVGYAPLETVKNIALNTINTSEDDEDDVPTMAPSSWTYNPNWSPLENQIADFTFNVGADALTAPLLNSLNNVRKGTGNIGRTIKADDNFKKYFLRDKTDLISQDDLARMNADKASNVSPFNLKDYMYAPGKSQNSIFGKKLFYSGNTQPMLTSDGAEYFNKLTGTNKYTGYDIPHIADLQLHINDVFSKSAPRASKTSGKIKNVPRGRVTDFMANTGDKIEARELQHPKKWTKNELALSKDFHINNPKEILYRAINQKRPGEAPKSAPILRSLVGTAGVGTLGVIGDDYITPLYNQTVPYLNAVGRKLGAQSDIFSISTRGGGTAEQGVKEGVMISLNDEGNTMSSARVNEKAEGDVIIGGEFIEETNNTVNKAQWFKDNQNTTIGDRNFSVSSVPAFYGVENGKFKAGSIDDFDPETIVVPIRPEFQNAYAPVVQAGVTDQNTLRLLSDRTVAPTGGSQDPIIYNNAPMGGKMIFYAPKTGKAWFIYNSDPNAASEQINKLISEEGDIRYIPIDNGRYQHYMDKKDGLLTEDDFKSYYSADISRPGNPGYNLVLKRQGKKFGGPIYRNGGEIPMAQYGRSGTYETDRQVQNKWNSSLMSGDQASRADSSQIANYAGKLENYLKNAGYTRMGNNPADRNALNDIGSAITRFSNKPRVNFTDGSYTFPQVRNESYVKRNNDIFYIGDFAPDVINRNAPLQIYHPGIKPNTFKTYENSNDYAGFYDYDKLAVTPWSKLSQKQKLNRIKWYGTSGTPFKSKKEAISFLTQKKDEPVITPVVNEQQVTNTPTVLKKQDLGDPDFTYRIMPTFGNMGSLIYNPPVYTSDYNIDTEWGNREGSGLMYTEPYQERSFYKNQEYPDYENISLRSRARGNYAKSIVVDGEEYLVNHEDSRHKGYGFVEIPGKGSFIVDYRSGKPELRKAPTTRFEDGGSLEYDDEMQGYIESYFRQKEDSKKKKVSPKLKKGGEDKDYFAGYLPMYYFL